jgi:hypothetical protein
MMKHEWSIVSRWLSGGGSKSRATVLSEVEGTNRGTAIVSVVYSMVGDIIISCLLFLLPIDVVELFDDE